MKAPPWLPPAPFPKKLWPKWKPGVMVGAILVYMAIFGVMHTDWRKPVKKGRSGSKGQTKLHLRSEEDSMLVAEYGRRKKVVKETCERHGAYTTKEKLAALKQAEPGPPLSQGVEKDVDLWNLLKKTSHHQFFVQREWSLMWCKIPKAASTSWLHAFLKLANVPEHEIPEDNGMGLHALLRDKYPILSKNLNKQYMPASIKFMVVRHPFERIMSAYVDKLQSYNRDLKYRGGYYFAMYGSEIVERYRPLYQAKFPKNPLFLQKEPSFVEFINYLIDTPITKYDEHWKPQFILCPPCNFKFDIIVKMETFKRDTDFILSQRELQEVISFSKKHSTHGGPNLKDRNLKEELFSQLSKNMVKNLYEKYRVDFEMFEYDMIEFLKYASDSEGLIPDVIKDVIKDVAMNDNTFSNSEEETLPTTSEDR